MAEGLEGVVATTTRLSAVDGEAGRLTIAGYAVEDLAPYASFEEVAYLLLHGRLPESSERDRFMQDRAGRRGSSRAAIAVVHEAAAAKVPPMDALRMAAALLSLGRVENPVDDAMTAIASFPTIVGSYWRVLQGHGPVPVRPDLPHAAHYLHQLFGTEPSAERARALETYLNTVCDHGLNASTFAARVIVSTGSDVISAVTGAVGARKPERRIETNVEFYTALLLHGLGLPSELFTPTFAVGRVIGWSAHCLEQIRDGRLIRPQSAYIGPTDRHFDRGHTRASG